MKKNWPIIVGLCLPVLLIITTVLVVYIPRTLEHPQTNFVYSMGGDSFYYPENLEFSVVDGHIVKNQFRPDYTPPKGTSVLSGSLYLYNVQTNTKTKLSLSDAQAFNLDSNPVSADGFSVGHGEYSGGLSSILFSSRNNYNDFFLKKGSYSKRLKVLEENEQGYYYGSFHFIGWVK